MLSIIYYFDGILRMTLEEPDRLNRIIIVTRAAKQSLQMHVSKNIRIFNGREVRIENSVTRVTVKHYEACRVMPNSYPE